MSAGQRRIARACGIALFLGTFGAVAPALAQPAVAAGARPARVEVSGGGVFVGGYGLEERKAELTPNTGSAGFDLFTTDNEVRQAFGVQARVGFVVTPAIVVEGGVRVTRPVYQVRVSGDAENAADITIEETLSQYVFDASVVWQFSHGGRAVPFVFGGAGYLRELHEEDALVEEGVEYHAGVGLKWWFGQSGRRFGLRGEGGISIRDGGFDFKDGQRVVPVVGGSVVYTF